MATGWRRLPALGWEGYGAGDRSCGGCSAPSSRAGVAGARRSSRSSSRRAGRPFDAIVMNHVIEHVREPAALLTTCRTMLRPGRGPLVCVTPNARSWGHRLFGWVNWMPLDPPRHIVLFTPSSLPEAAHRAGFATPRVFTSCANAQASAVGSLEIKASGRYRMNRQPTWQSELLSVVAQVRAVATFRADPDSGDELVLRCQA